MEEYLEGSKFVKRGPSVEDWGWSASENVD
jgi:hypothetical protein